MRNQNDENLKRRFFSNQITIDEYYNEHSLSTNNKLVFKKLLDKVIAQKEGDLIFDLLTIGHINKLFSSEVIDELNNLLVAEWHNGHEEIAAILANFPTPKSLNFIKECAETDWKREVYNDGSALRRQLFFILRKIDTDVAIDLLKDYSKSQNQEVRSEASFQLNRNL